MIISLFPGIPFIAVVTLWGVLVLAILGGAHALFWLVIALDAFSFSRVHALSARSPDGNYCAQVTSRGIEVRGLTSQKLFSRVCYEHPIRLLSWSPNGACLTSVSEAGVLRVWNAWTGSLLFHSALLVEEGASVSWSPDSKYLALVGADQCIQVWNAVSWECIYRSLLFSQPSGVDCQQRAVCCMVWSPSGRFLATSESNGVVRVWDGVKGDMCVWQDDEEQYVTSLAFSEEGPYLLMGNQIGRVSVLHVMGGQKEFWSYQHSHPVDAVYWGRGDSLGDVFVRDITGYWLHWKRLEVLAPLWLSQ